eukprot:COSAG06_NODE_6149_length_3084_cov_3.104188_4_plen_218_part_00
MAAPQQQQEQLLLGSHSAASGVGVGGHIEHRTLPAELRQRDKAGLLAAAAATAAHQQSAPPPPPTPDCPEAIATKIAEVGYLSVEWAGAVGTLPAHPTTTPEDTATNHSAAAPPPHDDAPGVQRALLLSKICGGPMVYFPGAVVYNFFSTVNITGQSVLLKGGQGRTRPGVSSVQGLMSASPTFIQVPACCGTISLAFFLAFVPSLSGQTIAVRKNI